MTRGLVSNLGCCFFIVITSCVGAIEMSDNPLLNFSNLPKFSQIKPEHIQAAITKVITDYKTTISEIENIQDLPTWDSLVTKLELQAEVLARVWNQVSYLNSVQNNLEFRQEHDAALLTISAFESMLGQNKGIYTAFLALQQQPAYKDYLVAQKTIVTNAIRDFKLSAVNLDEQSKEKYTKLQQELTELGANFSKNVVDSVDNWSYFVPAKDRARLAGIPAHVVQMAAEAALAKQCDAGWLFKLDAPTYMAIVYYADDSELRKIFTTAYLSKASELMEHGKWDNTKIINEIVEKRRQLAKLLGYATYADYALVTKMAKDPQEVMDFLSKLLHASKKNANQEYQDLLAFIQQDYALDKAAVQPWDIAYYAEKLKLKKFSISDELLREYFPEDKVLLGMFSLVNKLYGISIKEIKDFDTWHPDVRLFAVLDAENNLRGKFYTDLYARPGKRSGAWMADCIDRMRSLGNTVQQPVVFLTTNFSKPSKDRSATLTHDEVITIFHEFGHALHHLLTKVDHFSISGTHGVSWDAVELPSQFMENFAWEWEVVQEISEHIQTKQQLPVAIFNQLKASKNFQSALSMLKQLEFALFDFKLHTQTTVSEPVLAVYNAVRAEVAISPTIKENRFPNAFGHIFDGGYAAGYYGYKWAEVLSADAYAMFEETGIFNPSTGEKFLHNILEKGGTEDAMTLYIKFRGRKPNIDAFLRHSGLLR
jgi:oligopeptidase A